MKDEEKIKMLTFEYKMPGIAMMLTLSGYDAINHLDSRSTDLVNIRKKRGNFSFLHRYFINRFLPLKDVFLLLEQ